MSLQRNLSCDHLIITDGKDLTQLNAHIVKDTLGTLPSPPRVLIRNIYDQGNQKDKIKCQNVLFLLPSRVTFLNLVRDWLKGLKGLRKRNKQVLVLLLKHDIDVEDKSAIDEVIVEIKNENGKENIEWVNSFKDMASWWPLVMKFFLKVNSSQRNVIIYRLVFGESNLKCSKLAETVINILSNFELEESNTSVYTIRIINNNHREHDNTGITIDSSSDLTKLSKIILRILIDLDVIQTKQTRRVMLTGKEISKKVITWLKNIMFCVLFIITCTLNLPFFAVHIPLALIPCVLCSLRLCFNNGCTTKRDLYVSTIVHNVVLLNFMATVSMTFLIIDIWIPISIGIYTILWPIIVHDLLLLVLNLDYGVISLPLVIWEKIDISLLRILHSFFNIKAQKKTFRVLSPFLKALFTLLHVPLFILYYITFLLPLVIASCKRCIIFLIVYYTNFMLAAGFFIAGNFLLMFENTTDLQSSQNHTTAVMFILVSFYIFFFLCVCNMYCWTELDMKYGLLTSQCEAVDDIILECGNEI